MTTTYETQAKKVGAEEATCQGFDATPSFVKTQGHAKVLMQIKDTHTIAMMKAPRRILMNRGHSPDISMPVDTLLSMILRESWLQATPTPAKKTPSTHWAIN